MIKALNKLTTPNYAGLTMIIMIIVFSFTPTLFKGEAVPFVYVSTLNIFLIIPSVIVFYVLLVRWLDNLIGNNKYQRFFMKAFFALIIANYFKTFFFLSPIEGTNVPASLFLAQTLLVNTLILFGVVSIVSLFHMFISKKYQNKSH